ncbi:MAG: hypothetical protein JWM39_786 [Parcubacteria group bacterium]|nr:hypothetical protein [Parcubacteria group bacterium]
MKTLLLGSLAMAAAVVAPAVSFADTFAYVNTSGDVQTMDATTANQAILTAPNIATHSGVMDLNVSNSTANPVAGQSVGGV